MQGDLTFTPLVENKEEALKRWQSMKPKDAPFQNQKGWCKSMVPKFNQHHLDNIVEFSNVAVDTMDNYSQPLDTKGIKRSVSVQDANHFFSRNIRFL